MGHDHSPHEGRYSNAIVNWILIGFLFVAGYFLIVEHKAHLIGALYFLPYLLLLACSLMHIFMHHGPKPENFWRIKCVNYGWSWRQ